ncbi:Protein root UVB sensitive 5 [Ranunculus cassubicifolius]
MTKPLHALEYLRCCNLSAEEEVANGQSHLVLVERYSNGISKKYVLEGDLPIRSYVEEEENSDIKSYSDDDDDLLWLPLAFKEFILPAGFPGSVSDDYLEYMLLQFPTNITGWICHTLVTSSLLKAVGVGSFSGSTAAAAAAASAAAIRWVSKDGLGAVGRLFIGGRFGNLFDDDPKQWRMYADFIGSAGSIFDLTTPLYPAYFLPLAALGNLCKAVARGLKDPSFRVIQSHFAISGNLGDVAAKEEVWEVAAQLFGLALGILLLDAPGLQASYPTLALSWVSMRSLHLWLRYQSLSALRFNTINLKRGRMLVKSHVSHSTVPDCVDCNRQENILSWERFLKPRIVFGASVEEIIDGEKSSSMVKSLLNLYFKEKYILVVSQDQTDFKVFVSFKAVATSQSVLRSLWQAYWLYEHWDLSKDAYDQLSQSLFHLEEGFSNFLQLLSEAGWDTQQLKLKVPKKALIEEHYM